MDARAYRLGWPAGTTVFELDQPSVMTAKDALLADDVPQCARVPIAVDLADNWPTALRSAGFDATTPTAWLIDAVSAPGSVLCYDVVGKSLLDAPFMAGLLKSMADNGAPWLFGTDHPRS